jgi:hypothetical protein
MATLIRNEIALAFTVMLGASAVWEQTAIAEDVLSPLVAIPIASSNPVLGADNKTHLPYEIACLQRATLCVHQLHRARHCKGQGTAGHGRSG